MATHDDTSGDKENSEIASSPRPSAATRNTRAKKVHVISDSDNEANDTTRQVRRRGPSSKKNPKKKKTAAPESDYEGDQPTPSPTKTKRKGKAPAAAPKAITKAGADAATKAMAQLAINLSIDSARKESDLRKRVEAEQQVAQHRAVALERAVVYAEKRLQALQLAKELDLDPKLVGLPEDPLTISPPNDTTSKPNEAPATASASNTTPPASAKTPTSTTPLAPNESPSTSGPQTPVVYATPFSTGFGGFTPVTPFGVQGAFPGYAGNSFSNVPFAGFSATPFGQPHPFAQGHAQPNTSASRAPVYTMPEPGPEVTMSDV
ncbi:hypothetical protein EV421DRAFT_1902138 [Armillaria borealis]|uniref:Uncharacterized protein n=1 Tax=Armillaria borealis TaxID=47425 RepID=A0AA39MT89_9AGAR|nr:hypothetical protein EV421DRAFT_1902138 [Armillaria borealis]